MRAKAANRIFEQISLGHGIDILKDIFRVEELRINHLRRQVALANNENFGRDVSRRRGFRHIDRTKQLAKHPKQRIIVL